MIRRPYPPGEKGKRRIKALSEYGKELREKQKLRNWYNLSERQFGNYVKEILKRRGRVEDPTELLIQKLESRFDNVIFRLGFAISRAQARQLISHGHFLVNGKPCNIPSRLLKKSDLVSVRPQSIKKGIFETIKIHLKKHTPPSWLELNLEKLEGKVKSLPTLEEAAPPAEISAIFEYYSH